MKIENRDSNDHSLNEMEYRLQFEKLISEISQHFLSAYHHQVFEVIDITLQRVGKFAEVDRSFVFIFSDDKRTMSNTNEWCAPTVEPQKNILQELPLSDFPWFIRELEQGRNINLPELDLLPPEAELEKQILEVQSILSLAVVPMRYGGVLKGFLGFDLTRKQSLWKEEDFSLLRTVGDMIISAHIRKNLEHRLFQSEKMEAIGRLAGGIAHDFNNILAIIKGNGRMLQQSGALPREETDSIEGIINATESGMELTRRLLTLGCCQEMVRTTIDLNVLIGETVRMLRRLIPGNIEIDLDLQPELNPMVADKIQLEQVLMNLVINGADAMPEGGEIVIRTGNVSLTHGGLPKTAGVRPGKYLLMQVRDNGPGMDEATLEKAFEPFFTTKKPGQGTGLGLSTVYTIVDQSAGYMEIHSTPGKGTRVDIYFPVKPPSREVSVLGTGSDAGELSEFPK